VTAALAPTAALALGISLGTTALLILPRLSWLPLGRPGVALLGAVLMVATGALDPEAALAAVDPDALLLLFGMMMFSGALAEDGALDGIEEMALRVSGGSPRRLLALVGLGSAGLSALLVNDTVCVFLTPVVLRLCRAAGLPRLPYLLALATAANIGGAATLVGNPQNMLIGALSGLPFLRFTLAVGPAALLALGAHLALMDWIFAGRLPASCAVIAAAPRAPRRLGLLLLAAVAAALILGAPMGWTATGGALALLVARRRAPTRALAAVDWPMLVMFGGLFVVVEGLRAAGLAEVAFAALRPAMALDDPAGLGVFTLAVVAGANLVSNVPLVMVVGPSVTELGPPGLAWPALGFISSVAGNLTLVGSVANLIVAEAAAPEQEIGFWDYLRVGLPATALSLLVGIPALMGVFSIM
jgi:Na+/H+ antiporter NhaD/arsenite permease-like protein